MTTRRRERFIVGHLAWLLVSLVALSALGTLTYELYFVVGLIGFLVVVELTAPLSVTPAWRRRLRWVVLLGLLVFGYVVVKRVLAILPPGVF